MGGESERKRLKIGSAHRSNRGASEVIGVVLLVGLVVAGLTLVVAVGVPVLDDSRRNAEIRAAQTGMVELDATAERVGRQSAATERLTFDHRNGKLAVNDDRGRITVRSVDFASGQSVVVANESLGEVAYVAGETRIVTQGGAVFRHSSGGTTMVSTPEIEYRDGTLLVEYLTVEGDPSLDQRLRIRSANRSIGTTTDAVANPIESPQALTITIESEYYTAWAAYFRARTPGRVSVNHSARAVTVQFVTGSPQLEIRSGLTGTAPTGELRLTGTGAYTDSYDSSEAAYSEDDATGHGSVRVAGNVSSGGDATVRGDLYSGESVELSGSTEIDGTVHWTDSFERNGADYDGSERIDGIETATPFSSIVERQVARLADENDNADASAISGSSLSTSGSTTTITAGQYSVEAIDLDNEELVLDTTDGDIVVGVRDYVRLGGAQGSNITVRGNNSVRLYVASERDVTVSPTGLGQRQVNVHVGKKSHVTVPGDRSSQFWTFGTEDFNATIAGGGSSTTRATFTGVMYAPTRNGSGYSYVKQADVYGAVVSGTTTLGTKGAVHYDQALAATTDSGLADDAPWVTYLHVDRNSVTVTDAD
ncbi:DUF7289 family protein [Halostella pelagica]|uniref:DUF7289 family protein n=1 Tax=Halostella pelagica TaxID=2583824 RepID=UPI0010806E70|nr:hypothetical protein [Halostella pelagica]